MSSHGVICLLFACRCRHHPLSIIGLFLSHCALSIVLELPSSPICRRVSECVLVCFVSVCFASSCYLTLPSPDPNTKASVPSAPRSCCVSRDRLVAALVYRLECISGPKKRCDAPVITGEWVKGVKCDTESTTIDLSSRELLCWCA